MRNCKHPPGYRFYVQRFGTHETEPRPTTLECDLCRAQLPLGPSDESDPRVAVEVRAAEIAATLRETKVPSLNECEQHGWETHANDDIAPPILCGRQKFDSGYLAREIVNHAIATHGSEA